MKVAPWWTLWESGRKVGLGTTPYYRRLLKEGFWERKSHSLEDQEQCYWMQWCKTMKRVRLTVQSWQNKHVTEKLGVTEKGPVLGQKTLYWLQRLSTQPANLQWSLLQSIVASQWLQQQLHVMSYFVASESRRKRAFPRESVGGWRNDEFRWMFLALVGDRKGIQPQNVHQLPLIAATSYPSWNVISLHSSSFTIPSPVVEGHGGMVLKMM